MSVGLKSTRGIYIIFPFQMQRNVAAEMPIPTILGKATKNNRLGESFSFRCQFSHLDTFFCQIVFPNPNLETDASYRNAHRDNWREKSFFFQ